ncbi:unnamed protein product [Vicia faba]|uniref:Uncharacterized protein n=1 Tax=Vicia faba TaxID=3906 RepID=A0AAV0YQM9_VICFA|nr:unnamed protein product [Vicia faba]
MVIMENSIADMENIVLEIPIGIDVMEAIINVVRSHEDNIDVMKGSGLVYEISLLEPCSRVPTFQLDDPFNVLSKLDCIKSTCDIHISASLFKRHEFIRVVTTDGNVQLFKDDDIPIIVGDVDDVGVDACETLYELDDRVLP